MIIEDGAFALDLPASVALVSNGGAAASLLARIVARRMQEFSGQVRIGERDLAQLPLSVVGRRIAYAGSTRSFFRAASATTWSTACAPSLSAKLRGGRSGRRIGGSPRRSEPAIPSRASPINGSTTTRSGPRTRTTSTASSSIS